MTVDTATLDVRTIQPRERHPLIFQRLDALLPGQSIQLVNDHDPVPLYYQIQATRPQQFAWSYVEQGPEVWRATITRTATTPQVRPDQTVGSISERFPAALPVLQQFGLDLCCGASLTLEQAAQQHQLDLSQLLAALNQQLTRSL